MGISGSVHNELVCHGGLTSHLRVPIFTPSMTVRWSFVSPHDVVADMTACVHIGRVAVASHHPSLAQCRYCYVVAHALTTPLPT